MIERVPLRVANEIEALRQRGRTDRQIEKMLGLPNGLLSRRYLIDDSEEREMAQRRRDAADWLAADARYQASLRIVQRPQGWRPLRDCIRDLPNAGKHFRPTRRT